MNLYNLDYSLNVSTGEMSMIVYLGVVRRERFLADVTTRRATVCLPLFFDNVSMHVSGYDIFHVMCQVLELSRQLPMQSLS